jgi:hypothetical protein
VGQRPCLRPRARAGIAGGVSRRAWRCRLPPPQPLPSPAFGVACRRGARAR